MMTLSRRAALAATLALASAGCGTTATITKKDGQRYQLEIVRSTPTELIVATRGGERPIPRDQVQDIDHPGNVAIAVGSVALLVGAVNLLGWRRCEPGGPTDFCMGWAAGGGLVGLGVGMIGWGGYVWKRSTTAAQLTPAVVGTPDGPRPGAALALSF
ncbi:MAG TPA: hypothetical protein VMT03_06605 [Polyangia bacterium]|nr:hypothetical protein [Polyangia bacterium]